VSKISMIIIKYLSLYILFFVEDFINKIEKKIALLIEKYTSVKDEKIILERKNNELVVELEQKAKQIKNLEDRIKIMKISKSVDSSNEDVHKTKHKINEYVREIDKCLVLLSK
tara:strand:+ start:80 stop:418 length:339 start_codon:yes stop_codon:yes gene_type:complete